MPEVAFQGASFLCELLHGCDPAQSADCALQLEHNPLPEHVVDILSGVLGRFQQSKIREKICLALVRLACIVDDFKVPLHRNRIAALGIVDIVTDTVARYCGDNQDSTEWSAAVSLIEARDMREVSQFVFFLLAHLQKEGLQLCHVFLHV